MRIAMMLVLVVAIGGAIGCGTRRTLDIESRRRDVEATMAQVNAAWESEDVAAFSRLVAHDADIVCFGTDVDERWVGWDALEAGLRRQFEVFSDTRVTPHSLVVHVSENGRVAWVAQAMEVSTSFLGSPVTLQSRVTAVLVERDDGWLIVQFHYSVPISESLELGS